jgi:hypothetical protein
LAICAQPLLLTAILSPMTTKALDWLTNWLDANIPVASSERLSLETLTEQCLLAMISAGLAPDDIEPDAGRPLEAIIRDACASRGEARLQLIQATGLVPA